MAELRPVSSPRVLWFTVAVLVVIFDQATKWAASAWLTYGSPVPVVPGFNLTLLHNTGAAFSFLQSASGWQRWLFAAIAIGISAGIVWWLSRVDRRQLWLPLALALVLGGALGNLWDRLALGYVVDFIEVYYGRWSWPAFNVADSAICIGAVMLVLHRPRPDPS